MLLFAITGINPRPSALRLPRLRAAGTQETTRDTETRKTPKPKNQMNQNQPLEIPEHSTMLKCKNFRLGQMDRKAGRPCSSTNGSYLDGWYSPEKEIPPYVTRAEMEAFNL